jgi:putative hydrolase of the HAD superfamily
MAETTTIFFDVGGVLLTNGWDEGERSRVLPRFGEERAAFEARHVTANPEWESGRMTAREYFDATVFYEPRSFALDEIFAAVKAESKVLDAGCFELLAELAAGGRYRLCTLNNESRELNDYRIGAFGLRQYFSVFVCSAYVGEMKPRAGIYRAALELTQVEPGAAVFIDDRAENLKAARALGMRGIQFMNSQQLRVELDKLGVTI